MDTRYRLHVGDCREVLAWIQENWPAIRDTVVSVFSAIVAFVTPIVSEISTFIRKMLGIVVDWVDENWPLIQETVETIMEAVQSVIEEILDAVQSFWSEHGEAILDAARRFVGIDIVEEYCASARARIEQVLRRPQQLRLV